MECHTNKLFTKPRMTLISEGSARHIKRRETRPLESDIEKMLLRSGFQPMPAELKEKLVMSGHYGMPHE